MHLQRTEPWFESMEQDTMKNNVMTRGQLKNRIQSFQPFRNITKSIPTPNYKYIKRNKIESAQRNISTYSSYTINQMHFRKASYAASRPLVPVHYVQSVSTLTKNTPPPNLRNIYFFHCIYNMFCSYCMIVVAITIKHRNQIQ